MKKILLSLSIMVSALGAVALGSTGAFFSDIETSVGNTFAAGAIDLKIDNSSYYNGTSATSTSWDLRDLTIEKFFDFLDLKPGDYGEDTISLHVDTNDAYLCANITLTSNEENGQTEPEALIDQTIGPGEGELADNVNFIWWADDGDNVLETDEEIISGGPIGAVPLNQTVNLPLADSQNNIWTDAPGPVPGDQTLYIGKAWCFGGIEGLPLSQDGVTTRNPSLDNDGNQIPGEPEDGGYQCDGSTLNNSTQTDTLTADVSFTAVQARHNPNFLCTPPETRTASLTVTKVLVKDNGGNDAITDFHLFVIDGGATEVISGVSNTFPAGNYVVTEDGVNGYQASFSGDCDSFGNITLAAGDSKTCTITNNDIAPSITLKKVVTGSAPLAPAVSFPLTVDGGVVPQNTSVAVSSNSAHAINESLVSGYHFVSITGTSSYGKSCPAVLGGSITLDEGDAITCTITNAKNE